MDSTSILLALNEREKWMERRRRLEGELRQLQERRKRLRQELEETKRTLSHLTAAGTPSVAERKMTSETAPPRTLG